MIKISTETGSISKYVGHRQAIKYIKDAGFDYFDFTLCEMGEFDYANNCMAKSNSPLASKNYKSYLAELRKYADELGITCNQTHSPYPIYCKDILKLQKKAIIATSIIGGKIMAVHPDNFISDEMNAKIYRKLGRFAAKYGVKIAIENIWNWNGYRAIYSSGSTPKSLLNIINLINLPNVGACVDIGHAEMMGELGNANDFIRTLGDKLFALHIHDNDKIHDQHRMPFTCSVDFDSIIKLLKDINYNGELTLEVIYYYKTKVDNGFEAVKDLKDAASKLAEMFIK